MGIGEIEPPLLKVRTDLDHFLHVLTDISRDGLEKWPKRITCCGSFFEPISASALATVTQQTRCPVTI